MNSSRRKANIGDLVEILSPLMNPTGLMGIVVGEEVKVGFWDGDIELRQLAVMHGDPSWGGRSTELSHDNGTVRMLDERYVTLVAPS